MVSQGVVDLVAAEKVARAKGEGRFVAMAGTIKTLKFLARYR